MKRITIHEGTEPKNLSVDKLVTALTDGGSATWIPEDETQLSHLTATRNGRYRPASGFYGFSNVDVLVEGTAPKPGDSIPVKPDENERMENGTVVFLSISGNDELEFVPIITIANVTVEGVTNTVDFSNAKIRCVAINGLLGLNSSNTDLSSSEFWGVYSSALNNGSVQTHTTAAKKMFTYAGTFGYSGTQFYIGISRRWLVTGVNYQIGDTYSFTVTIDCSAQ